MTGTLENQVPSLSFSRAVRSRKRALRKADKSLIREYTNLLNQEQKFFSKFSAKGLPEKGEMCKIANVPRKELDRAADEA